MNIDLFKYLSNLIGDTTWWGETHHDNKSFDNMNLIDSYLTQLEDVRQLLLDELYKHQDYNKGNASAEMLHRKAGQIIKKHLLDEDKFEDFDSEWGRM